MLLGVDVGGDAAQLGSDVGQQRPLEAEPELHANPDIDGMAFYNSYLATYLERDVRSLANVGSLRDFERFLRACALRSANLLNKADLARGAGFEPAA